MKITGQHILISRVDAIGDVVLTLPMCGYLKQLFPNIRLTFLGRTYTEPVIKACKSIDAFINYDEVKLLTPVEQTGFIKEKGIDIVIHVFPDKKIASILKKAGINISIGTTNRWFHWLTCNRLVGLGRKNSNLHEAQLNIALLKPLGVNPTPGLKELAGYYDFKPEGKLPGNISALLNDDRFNLILHPKSNGSASEWGLDNFKALIDMLPPKRYHIFITGSNKERDLLQPWLTTLPKNVTDLTGQLTLSQLVTFIATADGLVAASTGPLHIAAASGIFALGLYPGTRPMHAGRWAPIGTNAATISSTGADLSSISPGQVFGMIDNYNHLNLTDHRV